MFAVEGLGPAAVEEVDRVEPEIALLAWAGETVVVEVVVRGVGSEGLSLASWPSSCG